MTSERTSERIQRRCRVLIADDDTNLAAVLRLELERLGHEVDCAANAEEALARAGARDPDVVLLDLRLGRDSGLAVLQSMKQQGISSEIILMTGHGTIDSAVEAMRLGAREYVTKPCHLDELDAHVRSAFETRRLRIENQGLKDYLQRRDARPILTANPRMMELLGSLDRVARSDVPVLIQGESGTGKELIARRIHERSPIASQPFVVVNCAVLRDELLESELFGHEKGAFTGATQRKLGLFEIASGGTLFLDEIGETQESVQAKLLRVLQSGEIRRVGGTETQFVATRVLAATNKSLEREVEVGRFRSDLLFRLNVVTLESVPLRERPEDVRLLFEHYLGLYGGPSGGSGDRRLDEAAAEALTKYSWPGNVRELENVVRRVLIFRDEAIITADAIRAVLPALETNQNTSLLSLAELEKQHILRVLSQQQNDKPRAAEILGISLKTLYNRLHSYGEME